MLQLLREAMQKKAKTSNGFLIDGYPRELEQGSRFENEVRTWYLVPPRAGAGLLVENRQEPGTHGSCSRACG